MKLSTGNTNTIIGSSGAGMTSTFGIANNSHMFHILSSGLYSDKIGAVLREVGCNAMDAHIAANMPDKPFQVKLPTKLDRSFYIKDWGPGLDDEEIKNIYTVYGISTKQDDESQTGGFGLGSKSPFAYTLFDTDNPGGFTIVSAKNGVKRIYVAHLNDEGAPAVTELGVHPADPDWPHGVMVTFPVQDRDIPEFHAKAQEIFQWFRVKPEILGLSKPLQEPEFRFKGSFFRLTLTRDTAEVATRPAVVMANVRYPIERSRLHELTPTMIALLESGVHLWVENGEVLMTPSRESLQYTDKTRKAVTERLKQAAREVAMRLRDEVMQPEETKLAWYRKVHSFAMTLPSAIRHKLADFLKEAGVENDQVSVITRVLSENTLTLPRFVGDGTDGSLVRYLTDPQGNFVLDANGARTVDPNWENTACRVWMYRMSERGVRRQEIVRGYLNGKSDNPTPAAINVLADTRVYYADTTNAHARVRELVAGCNATVLLVVPSRGVNPTHAEAMAKRIGSVEGIHGLPVAAASTLPLPQSVHEAKERRRKLKGLTLEEQMADEVVTFIDAATGKRGTVTLGELEGDGEKYYLVATGRRYQSWSNRAENGTYRSVYDRYLSATLQAMQRVFARIGVEFSGVVLLPTEAMVRKLKLNELGFKPAFIDGLQPIKDKWQELVSQVDRTPRVNLEYMYSADSYGLLGVLAHHKLMNTPAWQQLEPKLKDYPVYKAVQEFMLKAHSTQPLEDKNRDPFRLDLLKVAEVSGGELDARLAEMMSPYDIRNTFAQVYPATSGLDLRWVVAHLASDQAAIRERVIAMMMFALSLDGAARHAADQDEESGQPVLLAA